MFFSSSLKFLPTTFLSSFIIIKSDDRSYSMSCDCCCFAGLFMYPTIFTDVTDDMFIAKEESFGPVMIISRFADG